MKFLFLVFALVASSLALVIPNGPAVLPAVVEGSFGTFDLIPEEEHFAVPMPAPLFPDIPSLTRPLPLIQDGPMTYPMPIPEGPQTYPMPIPEGPQTFPMPIPEETPVAKALPLVQIILNIVSDKSAESLVDTVGPINIESGISKPIAEVPHGITKPILELPFAPIDFTRPVIGAPIGITRPVVDAPAGITRPLLELPVAPIDLIRPAVAVGSFGTFDLIPEEEHFAVPIPAPVFPDISSLTRPLPLIQDGPMTYPMPIPEGPQTYPMPIPEGPQTFPMPIPEEAPVAKALPLVQIILNIVSDKSAESLVDTVGPINIESGISKPIAEVPHGITKPILELPVAPIDFTRPVIGAPIDITRPVVDAPAGITRPILELPSAPIDLTRPAVVAPAGITRPAVLIPGGFYPESERPSLDLIR